MASLRVQERQSAPKVNYAASLAQAKPVSIFAPKSAPAASVACSSSSSASSSGTYA